ncbi:hypothetical protein DPMN_086261 [Dreissena polymorpha]|uniref:AD domain-containing protein n=1 Tax=Dreissena polymorpha TaxID=45954 RepID=A0A9D3YHI9_DREPO|nr:hypothetical protein DPMN_086261 [Dreissena polymorpha]
MLAIKCTPASGKHSVHDVKLFNLAYVSDVQVIKEADKDTSPPPVSTLNLGKISNRLRSNIEEKKTASQLHWSRSLSRGPAVVQYNCLNNHRQSVGWSYIVVMDEVTIRPPYNLESCHGKEGSKALDHVKKIVQKFIREYGQQKAGNSDDEGDLQELSDIKLASIARGQVNPDWDILFGDGEPGAEDFFMGPATVKKKDWSLPHEAFFPRHEIHDRETPFESLTDSNHFYDSTVDYEPPSNLPTSKTVETTQLTRLSVDTSLLSCPDWGYTDSIVSLLKDLAAEGDVQTPVTMLIVMKDQIRAHIDTDLQEDWFMSYLELLGRFKLWSIANHVIKLSNLPGIFMLNQQSTTIHVNCNMCNRLLTRSGWLCDRCKMITNVCSICCQPVKGIFLWCQGCSHGGHMQHIKDWLLQSNECPKGCGHICEYT